MHSAFSYGGMAIGRKPASIRSEEHTSELQSRLNLVCRLLLEKKKTFSSKTSDSREASPEIFVLAREITATAVRVLWSGLTQPSRIAACVTRGSSGRSRSLSAH